MIGPTCLAVEGERSAKLETHVRLGSAQGLKVVGCWLSRGAQRGPELTGQPRAGLMASASPCCML